VLEVSEYFSGICVALHQYFVFFSRGHRGKNGKEYLVLIVVEKYF